MPLNLYGASEIEYRLRCVTCNDTVDWNNPDPALLYDSEHKCVCGGNFTLESRFANPVSFADPVSRDLAKRALWPDHTSQPDTACATPSGQNPPDVPDSK